MNHSRRPLRYAWALLRLALPILAGCMGPNAIDPNGKPMYVINYPINTMCLDIPANRPCPGEQCVRMRQAAMIQFMPNQQRTYEGQMRAMQPASAAASVCLPSGAKRYNGVQLIHSIPMNRVRTLIVCTRPQDQRSAISVSAATRQSCLEWWSGRSPRTACGAAVR